MKILKIHPKTQENMSQFKNPSNISSLYFDREDLQMNDERDKIVIKKRSFFFHFWRETELHAILDDVANVLSQSNNGADLQF